MTKYIYLSFFFNSGKWETKAMSKWLDKLGFIFAMICYGFNPLSVLSNDQDKPRKWHLSPVEKGLK